MNEKNPDLENKEDVAEAVGVGAHRVKLSLQQQNLRISTSLSISAQL